MVAPRGPVGLRLAVLARAADGCTCDTGPAAAEGRAPPATTEATPAARRRCRASARRAGRSRAAYRCGAPGGREAQLGTVASRAKSRRRCLRQSTSKGDGHRPSSSASSYSCALKRRHTLDILKIEIAQYFLVSTRGMMKKCPFRSPGSSRRHPYSDFSRVQAQFHRLAPSSTICFLFSVRIAFGETWVSKSKMTFRWDPSVFRQAGLPFGPPCRVPCQ